MEKKELALSLIAPYFNDRSLCGFDPEIGCVYQTNDGKMCVFGKCMTDRDREKFKEFGGTSRAILNNHGEKVLKPEYRGFFSTNEWAWLQMLHDSIAKKENTKNLFTLSNSVFSQEELIQYSDQIKTQTTKIMKKDYRILVIIIYLLALFAVCFLLISCETPAGNSEPAEKSPRIILKERTECGSVKIYEVDGVEYLVNYHGGICPLASPEKTDSLCN